MWEVFFSPYKDSKTVGDVKAVFNKGLVDELVFTGSVNLDDSNGILAFVEKAKAVLSDNVKPIDKEISDVITVLTNELNK